MKSQVGNLELATELSSGPASNSMHGAGDKTLDEKQLPTIAVIVPVRNEEKLIARTIDSLLGQDYPRDRYELLVVDGRSTDQTREIVAQYASRTECLRLLDNPKQLSSAARNIGIRESMGEIVLVIDGHCEIDDRQYLREIAHVFSSSGADCIGRPQPLDVKDATTLQRAIAAARSSWLGHHPGSYIYSRTEGYVPAQSVAVAYRRKVFDQVGLFDERFDACEDVELNTRIDQTGLRCFFVPHVAVHYHPRSSLPGLFRQMVRYGRGRVRLASKHHSTLSVGSFLPAAFLLAVIACLPLCLVSAWLSTIYFATLAAYGGAIGTASVSGVIRSRSLQLLPLLPVVFVTLHAACGWGVLSEFVRRQFTTDPLPGSEELSSPARSDNLASVPE